MRAVFVLVAVCSAAGCFDMGGPAPDAGPLPDAPDDTLLPDAGPIVDVRIHDRTFDPKDLAVARGTTVRWKNDDFVPHTATEGRPGSPQFAWSSPYLQPGDTWQHTFRDPGTWSYYCIPHAGTMQGVVDVR